MARFLALDVDVHGLYLAAASVTSSGVTFERLLFTTAGVPLTAATAADLGRLVKGMLDEAKVTAAPLLVCLGRDRVILKDVTFPHAPPQEEPTIVRFQAAKDLTLPADDVVMDYVPIKGATKKDASAASTTSLAANRATAVFLRKDLLAAVRLLAETAGLKLVGVTPRPFAASAAVRLALSTGVLPVPDEPGAPVAVLSLWDQGGEFIVCQETEVLFSRSVPAMAIASEAALTGEIRRNLAVFATQFPQEPLRLLYVVEGLSTGQSWSGRLRTALPISVVSFDPFEGSPVSKDVPSTHHGGFLGPFGLIAARSVPAGTPINFVSPRLPRAEPSKNRLRVLVAALLVVAILGVGFLVGLMEVSRARREIANLTSTQESLKATIAQLKLDLKKLEAVEDFTTREVPWLDVFYDLSVHFPDIKKGKLLSLEGTVEKPPLVSARPGTPAPRPAATTLAGTNKNQQANAAPKEPPVARLKLVVASEDTDLADRLKDTFRPPFYEKTTKETGKREGTNENAKLFTIETFLTRRRANEFTEKLVAAPPPPFPKPKPEPDPEPEPFFDPLAAPAGGFNP